MENQPRVFFYGISLLLGTLDASLKKQPELDIIHSSTPYPGLQELGTLRPDVILFDLENGPPEAAFFMLATCPGLLLIGLDPDSDELLVLSCRKQQALSVSDLVRTIRTGTSFRGREEGGRKDTGKR